MRKLRTPANNPIEVYNTCVAAVSSPTLRLVYVVNESHIAKALASFDAATAAVCWASLPRMPRGHSDTVVAGSLTKKHLTDLYDAYMVRAPGVSRKIYDDILVAGGGFCPFCGGIGQVCTLDHYLPKSLFPLYSVLPANLVPCCRDCNSGKSNTFATQASRQTLHPYLDDEKYFRQRWIRAQVSRTSPISLKFGCDSPSEWSKTERGRVQKHFESYNLAYRFSVQAGAELARLIDVRSNSLKILTPCEFRAYLFENSNSPGFDLNGWSRTMYETLAETEWFWKADFTSSDWHLAGDAG